MEKRLIPLDSRPIRFFCSACERPFALSEGGETIERQRSRLLPLFVYPLTVSRYSMLCRLHTLRLKMQHPVSCVVLSRPRHALTALDTNQCSMTLETIQATATSTRKYKARHTAAVLVSCKRAQWRPSSPRPISTGSSRSRGRRRN
jgi:hypothetical protein